MPKVSVIIPVYGVENYIDRCASSLFEQTLDDIEYIFVDDCTPDNSISVLEALLTKYPRRMCQTHILHHEKNKGLPAARQTGLKYASGEYIIHCDSDDWVDTEMYRLMYEKAKEDDADMVVCNYKKTDGNEYCKEVVSYNKTDRDSYLDDLFHLNVSWAVWNKLIKSVHIKSIKEYPKCNMGEDMAYVLQMMYSIKKVSFIDRPLYFYFVNPLSITNTLEEAKILKNFKDVCENVKLVERKWEDSIEKKKFTKGLSYVKYDAKYIIKPLINKEEYYQLWKATFPNVEYSVLLDHKVSYVKRLRSMLVICKLYHIYSLVKRKLKY